MSLSYFSVGKKYKIRSGLPLDVLGLKVFPIYMSHYDEFQNCKSALAIRLATLPVKYMTKDYLSAVFAYEMDLIKQGNKPIGIFQRIFKLLQLSLRIEMDSTEYFQNIKYEEKNGNFEICYIELTQEGVTVKITPYDFSTQLRPAIAELNGIELPDESENVDLVIANEQKKEKQGQVVLLDSNADDLIASVAYLSHCRERDIQEWTVREFEHRRRAIDRDKRFTLNAQAELGGMVTFKKGNPNPSWCYDVLDNSLGTQSLSELNFGDAKQKQS